MGGVTTTLIATGAALAAVIAVILAWVAHARIRRQSDQRIESMLRQAGDRMDVLAAEIDRTVVRVRDEIRRAGAVAELGTALDMEDALYRVAAAAAAVDGGDAGLIRILGEDGLPVAAYVGLPAEAAEEQVIAGPPDGGPARAVRLEFIYGDGEAPAEAVRKGLAVPLAGDVAGFVAAYSRAGGELGARALGDLEQVAVRASALLDTARRNAPDSPGLIRDALTGLSSRVAFQDALAREVSRARRYGRGLSLLLVDIDDFRRLNAEVGPLGADALLVDLAHRITDLVRPADTPCRTGGDAFAVVLPEARRIDADALFARLQASLDTHPTGAFRLVLTAGTAELEPDDDAITLFERAVIELGRAKSATRRPLAIGNGEPA